MSNGKVKGILKGLRYISHIFEGEKEQEIQIGYPTDVKHVAHIGWDAGSVNSPSWMNEYKSSPGFASAPLNLTGDVQNRGQDNTVKWVSEDSTRNRRSSKNVNPQGQVRDLPELPKASRRQATESFKREKSDKPRQSRKSSKPSQPKDSPDGSNPTRLLISTDPPQEDGSPTNRDLPDIPKKCRRKKSKDNNSNSGGSSRSRFKAQSSDPDSNLGSPSNSRDKQMSLEKTGQYEREVSGIS